jgi:hypothetical protein
MAKQKEKQKIVKQIYYQLEKRLSWLIVLVVIITFGSFYFLLIEPKLQTAILEIQNNINWQKNILLIQKQSLSDMQKNLDFYRQVKVQDFNLIEALIPAKYPKEKLFGEIEDIILQNGFILSELNIQEIENKTEATENDLNDNLQAIQLNLSINGIDYSALKSFLAKLEKQLPLMNVISLDFSPSGENLSLVVNTYYFKP